MDRRLAVTGGATTVAILGILLLRFPTGGVEPASGVEPDVGSLVLALDSEEAGARAPRPGEGPVELVAPAAGLESHLRAGAAATPTLGEVLREWWGPEWGRVRGALEAAGHDLGQPFELAEWDAAAPAIEERLALGPAEREALAEDLVGWPRAPTPEWLAARYGLAEPPSAATAARVDAAALPHNTDLGRLVRAYLAYVDGKVAEAWRSGRYQVAPYAPEGLPEPEGSLPLYRTSRCAAGWCARFFLPATENLQLFDLYLEIRRARGERDRAAEAALAEPAEELGRGVGAGTPRR